MSDQEENAMPRFSDAELHRFRSDFEDFKADTDAKFERLTLVVSENSTAIRELAQATREQAEATQGVVQFARDFEGVARLGDKVRRFVLWASGIGGAAVLIWHYLLQIFNPPPPAS